MDLSEVLHHAVQTAHDGKAWRNIYTCDPTQDLYDDLVGPSSAGAIQALVEASRPAPQRRARSGLDRPFVYVPDEVPFTTSWPDPPWRPGRWGDGADYGVWYGALSEKTSLREVHYHLEKEARRLFSLHPQTQQIARHRAVYLAHISASNLCDLRPCYASFASILGSDDYAHCNELGRQLWAARRQGLLSLSVRDANGVNLSLFDRGALVEDKRMRAVRFCFSRDGACQITHREDITSAILGAT